MATEETYKQNDWLNRLRTFFAGDLFGFLLVLLAVLVVCFNQYVYGAVLFAFLISALLLLCSDIITVFLPAMLLIAFVIQAKNSYNAFMEIAWAVPPVALSFCLHPILYRKLHRPKKGELFLPILLISCTMFLGGLGSITAAEYFRPISLAYMFALGFLILFFYWDFGSIIYPGANGEKEIGSRIAKQFCFLILFLALAVLEYYVEHRSEFLADPGILPFQWRNNACTMLMIAMPFTFYLAMQHPLCYFGLSLISMGTIVMTGSRGGLVFGAVEFGLLLIYFAVKDKRHRKFYLTVTGVILLAFLCLIPRMVDFLDYTLERFTSQGENAIRLGLWKRSVEDFLSNPLTGRGLAYMGNRDLHHSATATLCWYHSTVPQIIGSFGILGILTFGYQYYMRIRFFHRRKSLFSRTVLFSWIGLELMSLVNPGIFVPIYLLYITVLFALVENYETTQE